MSCTCTCICKCKLIEFNLPKFPKEIAICHCSICKNSCGDQNSTTSFTKFDKNQFQNLIKNSESILTCRTSNQAIRGFRKSCKTPIYMIYDKSPNIWLTTNTFKFDYNQIPTYDIYVK